MSKTQRQARSKADLKNELIDQLNILRASCEAYDKGIHAAGKQISIILRVLLYGHGHSHSLLDQLGHRNRRFYSSGFPFDPRNLASTFSLLLIRSSARGTEYSPIISCKVPPVAPRLIPFVEWWNEIIIKDSLGKTFTRLSLVKHIADTDGGAHVDPGLEQDYEALSRGNSLGFVSFPSGEALHGRPHLACMRQIAHEVLVTLNQLVPEFSEHSCPVFPKYEA